jgi:hypothetical protein
LDSRIIGPRSFLSSSRALFLSEATVDVQLLLLSRAVEDGLGAFGCVTECGEVLISLVVSEGRNETRDFDREGTGHDSTRCNPFSSSLVSFLAFKDKDTGLSLVSVSSSNELYFVGLRPVALMKMSALFSSMTDVDL